MRVHHKLLKELANSFKLGKYTLETSYGSFKVKPSTIGAALGLNASGDLFPDKVSYKKLFEENKLIFRRFQWKTLKNLTDENMSIGVENEQDRLIFERIFILYIQMVFLLPTTINKISPVHIVPIFKMNKITEGNWRAHMLNFIIKGINNYHLKKKKSIEGCLFALMIIYFHLEKNKDNEGEENPGLPWGIVKKAETKKKLKQMKEKQKKQKNKKNKASSSSSESDTSETEIDSSSESESEEEAQSKKRKHVVEDSSREQTQSYDGSKFGTEVLQEFLKESKKKKTNEKAAAQGKKEADLQSTEGRYDSSETMLEVNLGSENDPLSQGQTDQSSINKPADSMLSLVEASDPAQQNMMVVRMETHSQTEALSITPQPPKPDESTPMVLPAPSKM
ncbi:hypothetical protein AHAS_Ahas07G0100500 [Arachis hypogaea]